MGNMGMNFWLGDALTLTLSPRERGQILSRLKGNPILLPLPPGEGWGEGA
jgi:hypothetical protein